MTIYATSNSNTNYLVGGLTSALLNTTSPDSGAGPLYTPGTRAEGNNGSEWMYVGPTTAAVGQYDVVWINSSFVPASITDVLVKTPGFVGFAQIAFATSESGWVMLSGKPTINCAINTNKNLPLYTSNTAGLLDDATVSGSAYQIMGVCLVASNGTTTAGVAMAAFPTVRQIITAAQ